MSKFLDQQGLSVLWDLIGNKYASIDEMKSLICRGYYYEGEFFVDEIHREKFMPRDYKLYIDITEDCAYSCDGENYHMILIPKATADKFGMSKLYQNFGKNIDGSVSQKIVSEEFDKKVEVELDNDTLILLNNL